MWLDHPIDWRATVKGVYYIERDLLAKTTVLFNRLTTGFISHLEKKCSFACILFIDFSSAFKSIIPPKQHLIKLLHLLKFPVAICD